MSRRLSDPVLAAIVGGSVLVVLLLVGGLVAAGWILFVLPQRHPPAAPSHEAAPAALEIGHIYHLSKGTVACTDRLAYRSMLKAVRANDQAGVAELMQGGRAFELTWGSRLKILDTFSEHLGEEAVPSAEVRVMRGPHPDSRCYVLAEVLEP